MDRTDRDPLSQGWRQVRRTRRVSGRDRADRPREVRSAPRLTGGVVATWGGDADVAVLHSADPRVVVPLRSPPQRAGPRPPGRRAAHRNDERSTPDEASTRPRWRPPTQPGDSHDHAFPRPIRWRHQGRHHPIHRRRPSTEAEPAPQTASRSRSRSATCELRRRCGDRPCGHVSTSGVSPGIWRVPGIEGCPPV